MSGITPMISPGVRVNVVDQSNYSSAAGLPENAIGIVGAAKFGPINTPVLLTSVNDFESTFSTPLDVAGLTAVNTLRAGGTVYYNRLAGNSAKAMSGVITGEGGNLEITATYKGTIEDGTWTAVVAAGSTATSFKLSVTNTQGTNEPTVMIAETELSLDPTAENYFTSWDNKLFTLSLAQSDVPTSITADNYAITNGDNGVSSTFESNATAAIAAIDIFSDREAYSLMYLTAPMYSTIATVAQKLVDVSNSRKDLVVQIDHDPSLATADAVITALKPYTQPNNSYVGMWAASGGYITDSYDNNAERLVPASAFLIPALAAEYSNFPVWTAPASAAYLQLSLLTKLNTTWTQQDRDKLYAANINPILNYKGLGYTAMGQKSGQTRNTAMNRLNVVQLVNTVKINIEKISVDFLFTPIDDETFSAWVYRVSNYLNGIKANRGLYDFTVKMDWETVTPEAVNNNLMPGVVQIKPTRVAEFIDVDLIIKNYSDQLS